MKIHELQIEGMNCSHCVMHVKKALAAINGLEVMDVQVGKASVKYEDEKIAKIISEKIEEAGYKVISTQ